MPAYFQRPENALKRANEFLEVGKKQPALDVLYDVIKSKKHRTWQKIHEPIMLKYLELCVDLRKSHLAKEGLYQYKNICQQVNIKSLEDVVRAYLKLAEDKTEAAKEESQQMVLDIEDLDNIQTPESVLLSAVSGEDTQDRTDRLLLTPWVKFLWESYRQCLDLLRNNSKVERLYHDIAQQAFKFCLLYTRKAEFRKLCDNLRMHLGQIQRHHNQSTAINLNNPESQSMHLETRLVQLDSAISMELWQEAFKAVEDIHGLFSLSKKPPKPQLMANYYNKVSTVFWKSGNALFHASTLHRLYHLSREMRKNLTQEEMQRMSTRVLLATLSIPITPERTDIARLLDMDGIIVEKHRRLATLLGLQSPPTRQTLINDMVRFNVLQYVVPDVKEVYNWLEVDFHPLKLCGRVTKVRKFVLTNAFKFNTLDNIVISCQKNNVICALIIQVAQIYQSIEFSRLASLVPFVDAFQLERAIVDAARHCDLQVRIDHTTRTLSFGSDLNYSTREDAPVGPYLQSMPSEQIRNQLTAMSSALAKALDVIKPAHILQEKEDQHQLAVTAYLKNARKEHQRILARRQTIEERKERLENLNIQREKEELEQREAELQKVRKAEEERLRQEAKEREKERIMQEHEQIKKKTVRERLEQIKKTELGAKAFKDIDIEDLEELDPDFIMAKQVEQLEKEKKELQERLKNQEKKIDYFERAKRLEEIPLIKKAYEEQRVNDMEVWEQQEEERIMNMKLEREKALEHKRRMFRMLEDRDSFETKLKAARRSIYEEKLKQFQEKLAEERKKRLEERKKQRKEDRRIAFYKAKEEEEQRVQEEQLKNEREERERIEREKREAEEQEYQERLRKLEEQERKKRQRELEIEERERRREEERKAAEDTFQRRESRWSEKDTESGWRKSEPDNEWRRGGQDKYLPLQHRKDSALLGGKNSVEGLPPCTVDGRDYPRGRGIDGWVFSDKENRGFVKKKKNWLPLIKNAGKEGRSRDLPVVVGKMPEIHIIKPEMDICQSTTTGLESYSQRACCLGPCPKIGMKIEEWRRGEGREDDKPSFRRDDDRKPFRRGDDDRGPRWGDDDRGPKRGGGDDDDRGPRRGMDDDRGPRRGDDSRPGPWRPLSRPVQFYQNHKRRETHLGKESESRPTDREHCTTRKKTKKLPCRETEDKWSPRKIFPDASDSVDLRIYFADRDEGVWRRAPVDDSNSWRDSPRQDDWDREDRRGDRDRSDRDRRDMRDRKDDRERRGPLRTDREETNSWRRNDDKRDDRREERDVPRRGPPPRDREREKDSDKERNSWRLEKDKEAPRRNKNEPDEEGWTTVRR
uniref:Eukaryotic translation initiation factor 3 subunit A n=1 Tax=Latimeria chalumnae TaxID=7897 RepID=H3B4Y5_LATCH